jgi:hypothetical protein
MLYGKHLFTRLAFFLVSVTYIYDLTLAAKGRENSKELVFTEENSCKQEPLGTRKKYLHAAGPVRDHG